MLAHAIYPAVDIPIYLPSYNAWSLTMIYLPEVLGATSLVVPLSQAVMTNPIAATRTAIPANLYKFFISKLLM